MYAMKDCLTASTENAPLNPTKRVNYNFGMILGVDDFRQEQAHFDWKHRISNLLLHGFGTVCGLRVTAETVVDPPDVLIRVSSGYGISQEGKWMWVDRDLCARLGEWLDAHGDDLSPALGAGRHTVYVTLCYAECPTDLVPIAGQPCASDEDTRAPSRVQEAYQVAFSWEPPSQPAEDAVRAFGDLMAQVEIVPDGSISPPVDDGVRLLDAVRALIEIDGDESLASPPLTSPPVVDLGPFQLPASVACETIHQVLVAWVTEVCPWLHASLNANEQDCILLACVDFDVDVNGNLDFALDSEGDLLPGSVVVDSCARPVLVPDRLKQELFCLATDAGDHGALGELGAHHHPQYAEGDHTHAPPDHGALGGLEDDDHPQYHDNVRGDARYARLDHTHDGIEGDFVRVPVDVDPYAIVAAGYFDKEGTPLRDPYNDLKVTKWNGEKGQYLLQFPTYKDLGDEVVYIVKGTLVDSSLPDFLKIVKERPYDDADLSMTPATFQVVELRDEGILVWITQSFLRYDLFQALARGEMDVKDDVNVLLFTPVDKAFMVEISAYGPVLSEYLSGYSDRISINTASAEELRSLPRIGPVLADRIVELREEIGGFTSLDQLKDVPGLDEFLVSRLRHLMKL
jgi:competence ComEA-like helix-hairpin-helix protein